MFSSEHFCAKVRPREAASMTADSVLSVQIALFGSAFLHCGSVRKHCREKKKRTSVENKAYGFSSPSLASFVKEATNMYVLLCECRETRFRPLDTGSVFVVQFIYMFCHVF